MKKILLVAVGNNNEMGLGNGLPWPRLPSDFKRFKSLTLGHVVIMGRKTYDSIIKALKRPLPGRTSIVLTRDQGFIVEFPNVHVSHSLDGALSLPQATDSEKVFIAGGVSVYREAIDTYLVDKINITRVKGNFMANTFFPSIDWSQWDLVGSGMPMDGSKNPIDLVFEEWTLRNRMVF
jgi:dihydrofolate reductase